MHNNTTIQYNTIYKMEHIEDFGSYIIYLDNIYESPHGVDIKSLRFTNNFEELMRCKHYMENFLTSHDYNVTVTNVRKIMMDKVCNENPYNFNYKNYSYGYIGNMDKSGSSIESLRLFRTLKEAIQRATMLSETYKLQIIFEINKEFGTTQIVDIYDHKGYKICENQVDDYDEEKGNEEICEL